MSFPSLIQAVLYCPGLPVLQSWSGPRRTEGRAGFWLFQTGLTLSNPFAKYMTFLVKMG
jgi:hypothetical protein